MKSSIKFTTLKKNSEIKNLVVRGSSLLCKEFRFKFLKTHSNTIRYAISVNKKVFRIAVLRNKIKRQIRAIIRNINNISVTFDILIIVNQKYFDNDFATNNRIFVKLLNKIR